LACGVGVLDSAPSRRRPRTRRDSIDGPHQALRRACALERRVGKIVESERRIEDLCARRRSPKIDRPALIRLAHDLPAAWNAPTAEPRTKQRLKVRVDHIDVVLMPAEFASALAKRPN